MIERHPAEWVSPNIVNKIRCTAGLAEGQGQLLQEQLDLIIENNWFNIFVPQQWGGLGMQLPEALRLLEAVAWMDGSFGWSITLCSGANWFIGFFEDDIIHEFFKGTTTCLAGSGAATGNAITTNNGYLIEGKWKYVTGAPFATAFTVNCMVQTEQPEGAPIVRPFILHPSEVEIEKDWFAIGMRATASYSIVVKSQTVDKSRVFDLIDSRAVINEPLYRIPFLQFAELTLAVNFSGMALHFIEQAREILEYKIKANGYNVEQAAETLEVLGRVYAMYGNTRAEFFEVMENAWDTAVAEHYWCTDDLKKISQVTYRLAKISLRAADSLYSYCGMMAADSRSEINRVWRDLHTASQHALFMFKQP